MKRKDMLDLWVRLSRQRDAGLQEIVVAAQEGRLLELGQFLSGVAEVFSLLTEPVFYRNLGPSDWKVLDLSSMED